MLNNIVDSLHGPQIEGLAKSFRRLGRLGFWLQVVLGSFPVFLMVYIFIFTGSVTVSGTRAGLPLVEYLTILSLLVLLFTTLWFYRYPGIGRRLLDPDERPTRSKVLRTVWIGLVASSLGALFSMVVLLLEVAQLLFYFLAAPQGGIPAIQTTPGGVAGAASWVSTVDLASLMALLLSLTAEVIVMMFGLWLLFRASHSAEHLPESAGA
jgi:hypothetical protein